MKKVARMSDYEGSGTECLTMRDQWEKGLTPMSPDGRMSDYEGSRRMSDYEGSGRMSDYDRKWKPSKHNRTGTRMYEKCKKKAEVIAETGGEIWLGKSLVIAL